MRETIKISRDSMISRLIGSTFDHIEQCPETLQEYLQYGFKGFENYNDAELILEYRDYISENPAEDIEIIMEVTNA